MRVADNLHKNHLGEIGTFNLWRKSEIGGYLRGMYLRVACTSFVQHYNIIMLILQ